MRPKRSRCRSVQFRVESRFFRGGGAAEATYAHRLLRNAAPRWEAPCSGVGFLELSLVVFVCLFIIYPTFLEHLCTCVALDARGYLAWTSFGYYFISSIIIFKVIFKVLVRMDFFKSITSKFEESEPLSLLNQIILVDFVYFTQYSTATRHYATTKPLSVTQHPHCTQHPTAPHSSTLAQQHTLATRHLFT